MSPNTKVYLTNANYKAEKGQIFLEFSNPSKQFCLSFPFKPSILVNLSNLTPKQKIYLFNQTRLFALFKDELGNNIFSFSSKSFPSLEKFQNLLSEKGCNSLLLSPERQFLLTKNWSYFNCFELVMGQPKKQDSLYTPNVKLNFLVSPLPVTAQQLILNNKTTAENLLKKIILSNLLTIPFDQITIDNSHNTKLFLENLVYKQKFLPNYSNNNALIIPQQKLKGTYTNITELNFSKLFLKRLTNKFYNLSFDTLCCDCCKPLSLKTINLLPHSLVKVKIKQDSIFLQSTNRIFSNNYHKNNPYKESRENYMYEFYLEIPPLGPFNKGQIANLPLADIKHLKQYNYFTILGLSKPEWFCTKKESVISKQISHLFLKLSKLSNITDFMQKKSIRKGILSYNNNSNNVDYIYFNLYSLILKQLLNNIAKDLTTQTFIDDSLQQAYYAVQQEIIDSFKEFSSNAGSKAILSTPAVTLLNSNNPLSIAKAFSEKFRLPLPELESHYDLLPF